MLECLETYQLPCFIKGVFGIECPVCGLQRAFFLLLKGDVWTSISTWPALIPLLFFLALSIARILGLEKISMKWLKSSGFICLALILISYLFKFIKDTYLS